ncbi:PREDICTED: astacin-like metalloendopeptidase [Nanorana parkeri]|uniref:astacin-like metalloendopeptidase n=1 Tax=Nanorana parkeri TaxID=125878 RepID=UPI0008542073|nr:PREDICTED: astacin-like metalloendopeptidase [Nanorana parkeri]
MDRRRISFALLASLIHACIGVPLQINFESVYEKAGTVTERPKVEPPDVFSLISASNKESNMLMREGDIAVDIGRSAIKCDDNSCRWSKNSTGIVNVPYTLSPDYSSSDKTVFLTAMEEYATLTCVRFIERTSESDYLQIMSNSGCWSYVGKRGGGQPLSVVSGCIRQGSIQHELNHALGFFHEQSRSDRDNYINIMFNNILPGTGGNFQKYDTLNLGTEYDYGSVMHYPSTAFSVDGSSPTIVPKPNASVPIGQRYGLSTLDVSKINKLYDCGVCRTLLSDSSGSLTSSNYPNNYPGASRCLWLIRIPSNLVFLQFSAFDVQATQGCASDYLRIYDGPTTSSPMLLDKACGAGQLPPMISTTNTMLLEFVSDSSTEATGFKASYSTVTCGSVLTNPMGTFSTPNYPSSYPPSMDCTWVLTAPPGFIVSVNMTDFTLEYKSTCTFDYMLAFDGPKITSPLMGRYCGKTTPPALTSTGNSLLIQAHSDNSIQLKGFLAKYAFGWDPWAWARCSTQTSSVHVFEHTNCEGVQRAVCPPSPPQGTVLCEP